MTMKPDEVFHCPSCEQNLPAAEFTASRRTPWGLDGYCNRCWRHARAKAHGAYRSALADGRLVRPTRCQRCLTPSEDHGTTSRVVGHHLDYRTPLFVVWVCTRCHLTLHNNEAKSRLLVRMVSVSD